MLTRLYKLRSFRLARCFSGSQSDLLAEIKNRQPGIYEPQLQDHVQLDPHKMYFKPVGFGGVSLAGLQSTPDQVPVYKDPYAHHNDLSLFKYFLILFTITYTIAPNILCHHTQRCTKLRTRNTYTMHLMATLKETMYFAFNK